MNFPVSEMSGEEQDATPLRKRLADTLFAVALDGGEHLAARERTELQQLEQQRPEVRKHVAHQRTALRRRPVGKPKGEILLGNTSVRNVEQIRERSNAAPNQADNAHRQQSDERLHRSRRERLHPVAQLHAASPIRRRRAAANRAASHALNRSGGSMASWRGSTAHATVPAGDRACPTSDCSRTASFSVVITRSTSVSAATRRIASTSRAVYQF